MKKALPALLLCIALLTSSITITGTYADISGRSSGLSGSLFSQSRDWNQIMPLPGEQEINAHNNSSSTRSPYVTGYYNFSGSHYSQFAVDFKADYIPKYTYLCPVSWWMDTSCVKKNYKSIDSSRSAYAGFQYGDHGTIAIMSVWDTAYTDKNGNKGYIHAKVTYYNPNAEYVEVVDNGEEIGDYTDTFTSCRVSFDWQPGHWYRTLIQYGTSPTTGNTSLLFWVYDLSTGTWTELMEFDLGMKGTYMTSFACFLENYSPSTSGNIRTMELTNARAYNAEGTWKAAKSIKTVLDAAVYTDLNGSGSCKFFCDGTVFGVITTGISGLAKNKSGETFTITSCETGSPF